MSSFTSPLIVSPQSDGRNWRLVQPFTYHIGSKYNKNVIKVPKGFVTDFASVPQPFWSLIPYWGKWGKASVLHDWLYKTQERTRKEADDIFLEAMIVGGTNPFIAKIMYYAVRIFAFLAWKG